MAVFILNPKKILEQYEILKNYADVVGYNFKTNKEVGKFIENKTNAPLVMNSLKNIETIKDKKRIIFLSQGEDTKTLRKLLDTGINNFIVDNENDLNRILSLDAKINLSLRMKVREHTIYTGKYFVYGIAWQRVNKLVEELRKNENIEELSVHFHRKTQNVGEWSLVDEFQDSLNKDTLSLLDFIKIGGGIPVQYKNSNPNIESILNSIKKFKLFLNDYKVKLMLEPGRFIAAPSVKLEANIINAYDRNLILDCSIYNAYMDTFLMNIRLLVENETNNGYRYLLKGCSPDSLDIFRYNVFFNKEKKIGDKIVFLNAGAYNFYTEFNDLPKIKTIIKNE